uniref:Retroviral polymerase SH3-like domain-containing protein n=1 Tax=Amphimedon queenslandica TaxID=400682 RepID=A0A1X7SV83_AMPQE
MEAAQSMMSQARLSKSFWAEAVATATYLRNRMVTTALKNGLTPYYLWSGKKPDLSNIRTFGCMVYSHIPEGQRRKLDMKANKLRFVGYTESTSNYKVWDEVKRRCYVRHDLIFNEDDFGETNNVVEKEGLEVENEEPIGTISSSDNRQREDPSQEELPSEQQPLLPQHEDSLPQSQPESSNETQPEPRRSERSRKPPTRYGRDDFADKACHFAHQA